MSPLHPVRLLHRPRALLLCLLLFSALMVSVAMRLRLEGNVIELLPRSSSAARTFATFTRSLVAGQELVILVLCDDPTRLTTFADEYAAGLTRLPGARQVTYRVSRQSADYLRNHLLLLLNEDEITELSRRLLPEAMRTQVRHLRGLLTLPGGGAMAPLLTADPLDLLLLIGKRIASGLPVDAQSGYFRTVDGKALVIKVRPGFDPMDWDADQRLLDGASALARSLGAQVAGTHIMSGKNPVVAFTGSYAFPPYYKKWLEQDSALSTIISAGSVLLLFALFFRSLRILPIVALPLGCAGLWTAAAAALFFHRINGVSIAFGTILVAIGIDLPIQLYNRLREELLRLPPHEAVRHTIATLAGPAVLATLGPAAVFFCCALSDYRGLKELGILSGVGLCLNCIAMLTMFPALLIVMPTRLWYGRSTQQADRLTSVSQQGAPPRGVLAALLRVGHPRAVLLFSACLLLLALPLARRLTFDRRLLQMEPDTLPPAAAEKELGRRFGDRQHLLAALIEDSDPDRALWRADLWQKEAERLRTAGLLRGYQALGTLVPSRRTQEERLTLLRRLDLPAAGQRLEAALAREGFDTAPFASFLLQLKKEPVPVGIGDLLETELGFLVRSHMADVPQRGGEPARRVVANYLFVDDGPSLSPLLAELSRFARTEAGGSVTGRPLLELELRAIVERDTRRVTLASVVSVALLLLLFYRRWRPIVAVLLPLSLAWVLFAAVMSLLGLKLNLYNLLAIPLCIGYGIDDHVFLVHRHEATPPHLRDPARVLFTTGRAIVLTTLSTMVGFAGLLVAHFEGLRLLGISGALAVLLCLFAAFAVLPALLALLWPRTPA